MTGARRSAILLALLSVLWVAGCSGAPTAGPGGDVSGSVSDGGAASGVGQESSTSGSVASERVAVSGSAPAERLSAYEAMTSIALAQVEDLWGPGSVRWHLRVLVPGTAVEFSELTGGAPASQGAPAVTVGSMAEAHVVVHPDSWDRLTPQGRQAVLTHEVTHLAQQGDGPVPPWLGEGIAEFTAHRHSALGPAEIAGSALDGVRAGEVPTTWPDLNGADPTSTQRTGTDPTSTGPTSTDQTGRGSTATGSTGTDPAWGGYALAWLACLYVAQTWSEDALLELYETVAGGMAVREAVPAVLDVSEEELLAGWAEWLTELAG